jgi:hypothetical protein
MTEDLSEGERQVVGGGEVGTPGAAVGKMIESARPAGPPCLRSELAAALEHRERVNAKSDWFGGCGAWQQLRRKRRGVGESSRGGRSWKGRERVATPKAKLGLQGWEQRR